VVGHHQEIQRTGKLDALARARNDFLAAGEPVSIRGAEFRPDRGRIERKGRMQVCVAPIDTRWIVSAGIG
jgi:hypothetical protein